MGLVSFIRRFRINRLVKNGLTIGKDVYIGKNVCLYSKFCWLVSIGNESTLAPGAVILVHDVRTKKCLDYTKIGEVTIGNKTFIGANSVILPNANIGNNVIIGAGSVVTHDIPDGVVAVSNSAKIIKTKSEYVKLHEANLKTRLVYQNKRQQISDMLDEGIGYVNKWLFFGNRQCYNRFHTPRIFA